MWLISNSYFLFPEDTNQVVRVKKLKVTTGPTDFIKVNAATNTPDYTHIHTIEVNVTK